MAQTIIPVGDPKARVIYSAFLAQEFAGQSFFVGMLAGNDFEQRTKKSYLSTDPNMPIQRLRDLESSQGDTIKFDLVAQLGGQPTYGDNQLRGKEEKLVFYTDQVSIDQVRHGVNTGGRMTKKRTIHDLRKIAKDKLISWLARFYDEAIMCYLAGVRGISTNNWLLDTSFSGFAGNSLQEPDSDHVFGIHDGDVTNDIDDIDTDDYFSLDYLEELDYQLSQMENAPQPLYEKGEAYYVILMHAAAKKQLRTSTSTNDWLDIQKNAGVRGSDNPIFKGALGRYGKFVLHDYGKVPVTKNAGDVSVCRTLCLGAQSAVIAWGDAGNEFQYNWHEETEDRGNVLVVDIDFINGIKKTRFNGKDFGCLTLPHAI